MSAICRRPLSHSSLLSCSYWGYGIVFHRAYQLTIYQVVSYFASVQRNARTLSNVERDNTSMVPAILYMYPHKATWYDDLLLPPTSQCCDNGFMTIDKFLQANRDFYNSRIIICAKYDFYFCVQSGGPKSYHKLSREKTFTNR